MKKLSAVCVLLSFYLSFAAQAETVSVTNFKSSIVSHGCSEEWGRWTENYGSTLKSLLVAELANNSKYEVLEREEIEKILDHEVELNNSQDQRIKKGQFKKAKFTFIGEVVDYQYCASKSQRKISLSTVAGLFGGAYSELLPDVETKKRNARIGVEIRVVDTETGRVVARAKGVGEAESSEVGIDSTLGSMSDSSVAPVGEASRTAIKRALSEIKI